MDHRDHVRLIRDGVAGVGPSWADLGAGTGAFTLALADLLGPTGTIEAIDRDAGALAQLAASMAARFPDTDLHTTVADFTHPLELPHLDGVVMANSLHFVRDPPPVLALVLGSLRPGGHLVVVEYDSDRGNPWVPFPFSYRRWQILAADAGFVATRQLGSVPSRFLGSIYSALSLAPDPA
ncbi:MAG: class I SAM-dependent methyltransferase [Candidatus Limnocylindrales bacterium]